MVTTRKSQRRICRQTYKLELPLCLESNLTGLRKKQNNTWQQIYPFFNWKIVCHWWFSGHHYTTKGYQRAFATCPTNKSLYTAELMAAISFFQSTVAADFFEFTKLKYSPMLRAPVHRRVVHEKQNHPCWSVDHYQYGYGSNLATPIRWLLLDTSKYVSHTTNPLVDLCPTPESIGSSPCVFPNKKWLKYSSFCHSSKTTI